VRAFLGDFKKFILRGNVLDLAVAVIIGAAFNTVIQSLVNNLINPLIGFAFGKPNFKDLVLNLSCKTVQVDGKSVQSCKGVVAYGSFLTDVVNFVIIGFSVFIIIKTFERLQNLRKGPPQEEGEPLTTDQELLTEIRDLLRERPPAS
jgi:large conductance mechanosensitive channel